MNLKKLRLQQGLTQEKLSELSGLNIRTIQRIEKGEKGSIETYNILALVFELSTEDFNKQNTELKEKAEHYTENLRAFYYHLGIYISVSLLMLIFRFTLTGNTNWTYHLIFAWGVYILIEALTVFDYKYFLTGKWKAKQVKKFIQHNR